ncbi:PaaI family thioesterase [Paraconexibacter sp.]|uniref:PaaI family thioesterase n=1 Tax=Paraconexibacter sp. TaxID=2949640 RepID=UPI003562147E
MEERFDEKVAAHMLEFGNQMPGLQQYLGISFVKIEAGRLWAEADLASQEPTPSGNLHGGVIAAVLDHVTGAVVYPVIPVGHWGATTELKINYLAPVAPGILRAEASVLGLGNRSAVVRGEAYVEDRLVAAAQGTITIVAPRVQAET